MRALRSVPRFLHRRGLALVTLGGLLLVAGCGRNVDRATAPGVPSADLVDTSALPPDFQDLAREMATAAAASPATPLTDAEARQLLADNDLGWRVGVLADRLGYRALNALRATREATGVVMTRGRVVIQPEGGITYDLGVPSDPALTVVGGAGPALRMTLEAGTPELVAALLQSPMTIGQLAAILPAGRMALRIEAADRLDLRLTLEVVPGAVSPPATRVVRHLEGWIALPGEGRSAVRARAVDDTWDSFHGGAIVESVTAVVTTVARRALLSERHDRFGYFDPTSMSGGSQAVVAGIRFTRCGARAIALPDLELKRYFESRLVYDAVKSPDAWRATGHFISGGDSVAEMSFTAAPVAGTAGGPGFQLVRPGVSPVSAQDLPARPRLDALVPDPFPAGWPHGRLWNGGE